MITLWKCAIRNSELCSTKSAGGTESSTPVMPPSTKVTMKPIDHSIGVWKRTRPPHMVNSQLKIFTPVGTAMIIVMMPKKPLTSAPAPIVKKWCNQTRNDRMQIAMVATIIERYPNSGLPENVETTSEYTPNAGSTRMYTSG